MKAYTISLSFMMYCSLCLHCITWPSTCYFLSAEVVSSAYLFLSMLREREREREIERLTLCSSPWVLACIWVILSCHMRCLSKCLFCLFSKFSPLASRLISLSPTTRRSPSSPRRPTPVLTNVEAFGVSAYHGHIHKWGGTPKTPKWMGFCERENPI